MNTIFNILKHNTLNLDIFCQFTQLNQAKLKEPQQIILIQTIISFIDKNRKSISIECNQLAYYIYTVCQNIDNQKVVKIAFFVFECINRLDSKKHKNHINDVCRRFRLSITKKDQGWLNQLVYAEQIDVKNLLINLKQEEERLKFLINNTSDNEEIKSNKSNIAEVRVFCEFVIEQNDPIKRKKNSSANSKQKYVDKSTITIVDAEVSSSMSTVMLVGIDDTNCEDETSEVLNDNRFVYNDDEKLSISEQSLNLISNVKHTNKNQLNAKTNPTISHLDFAKLAFQKLHQLSEKNITASLLMLSIYTSLTCDEIIEYFLYNHTTNQSNYISVKNKKIYITKEIKNTDYKKYNLKDHLSNKSKSISIECPAKFYIMIDKIKRMDYTDLKQEINEILRLINEDQIYRFTIQRIAKVIPQIIYSELNDELASKIIEGISVKHYVPLYYCTSSKIDVLEQYEKALILLDASIIQTDDPISNDTNFGSQQYPSLNVVMNIFKNLLKGLYHQFEIKNIINHFSFYVYHCTMILTGARPSNNLLCYQCIDFRHKVLGLIDKENRHDIAVGRFIPICDFLIELIQSYLDFIKFAVSCKNLILKNKYDLDQLNNSNSILLFFDDTADELRSLRINDIAALYDEIQLQMNWTRHFAHHAYMKELDQCLVNSLFAHDKSLSNIFDECSSFEISELNKVRTVQQNIVKELRLIIPARNGLLFND